MLNILYFIKKQVAKFPVNSIKRFKQLVKTIGFKYIFFSI